MEVNLYSRTRGVNRFKGLAATMRMLAEHGVRVPGADELCTWVEKAPKLSNPALEEAVAAGGGAGLQKRGGAAPSTRPSPPWAMIRGRFPAAERPWRRSMC